MEDVKRGARLDQLMWRLGVCLVVLLALAGSVSQAQAAGKSRGDAAFAAGMAAAKSGHYATAAHDFEQALLQGHTDPNTFYQLGLAWSKLKDWNDASWALAQAASDAVFAGTHPGAGNALVAASQAGGANSGPPPLLRNVHMTPTTLTSGQRALIEARAALISLQGNDVYYVAPVFSTRNLISDTSALTTAAADLANTSSMVVKFIFLSATPSPYTKLSDYAREVFSQLQLHRAVTVVVTPGEATAYSDRLSAGDAQRIADAQRRADGLGDPFALAAGIARAVDHQADADETANTRRTAVLGGLFALLLLSAVGVAIWRVIGQGPRVGAQAQRARLGTRVRTR